MQAHQSLFASAATACGTPCLLARATHAFKPCRNNDWTYLPDEECREIRQKAPDTRRKMRYSHYWLNRHEERRKHELLDAAGCTWASDAPEDPGCGCTADTLCLAGRVRPSAPRAGRR